MAEKSKKELKAEKKAAKKAAKKAGSLFKDFKAFISRGNVVDMAVGVVIGGAFGAIVTAVVNVLLSLCMWPIPGGINGLVTILPALKSEQAGYKILGEQVQSFASGEFVDYANAIGIEAGAADPVTYGTNILNANYTKYGSLYVSNGAAVINWGAIINALIAFIVIALVLFAIVKTVAYFNRLKEDLDAKAKEAYYQKHPEARPAPVEPEAPKPTEAELLTQIRDLLAAQQKK